MATTIQVDEKTLLLLKKLKGEYSASSYDETIRKIAMQRIEKKSMGGFLSGYYKKKSVKEIVKELQDERKKGNRF